MLGRVKRSVCEVRGWLTKGSSTYAVRRRMCRGFVMLSPSRAARELDVSISTLRRLINEGYLPAFRIGGEVMIRGEDLDAFELRLRLGL